MKPDIHPTYYEDAKVHCGSCGRDWTVGSTRRRAARRRVWQLPPVLHGQADDHRHGRPGRALPEAPGAPGPDLASRDLRPIRAAGLTARRSDSTADFVRAGRLPAMPKIRLRRPGPHRGCPHARSRCDRRRPPPPRRPHRLRDRAPRFGRPRAPVGEVAVRPRPDRPVRDARRGHALAHPQRERPGRGRGDGARQGLGRGHARAHRDRRDRDLLPPAARHRHRHDRRTSRTASSSTSSRGWSGSRSSSATWRSSRAPRTSPASSSTTAPST